MGYGVHSAASNARWSQYEFALHFLHAFIRHSYTFTALSFAEAIHKVTNKKPMRSQHV